MDSRLLLRRVSFWSAGVLLLACWTGGEAEGRAPSGAQDGDTVRFSRDIRPLLSGRCFQCHGPDPSSRKADLRLDLREEALRDRDGTVAIVPGDLEASELWYRVSTDDESDLMPPPESHRASLNAGELDLIRRWIEQGAEYERHWAFEAPERPVDSAGGGHGIDGFLGAKLAEAGLTQRPAVAPELALRRLFLDLTGLPPSLAELEEFQAELHSRTFDQVWAEQVARLFTEEPYRSRYAERMTSPWLDQARYADTIGIHTDNGRQIWPWRDWVLAAYRGNMPFDQFLTEQLAGDLLPNATVQQRVATGFLRNHVITDEGGAIPEEYLVEYAVDRVDTTSQVFLGLTVGCARCHDHKFDPIKQSEYFSLFAFFASNDEPGLYTQESDANRAFEPAMEVPTGEQLAERERLIEATLARKAELSNPSEAELQQLATFKERLPADMGLNWVEAPVRFAESKGGATLTVTGAGSVLASKENPDTDTHTLVMDVAGKGLRLIQLDVLGHGSFSNGAPGRAGNGNAVLTGVRGKVTSIQNAELTNELTWSWVWSDFAQDNEDYSLLRALGRGPHKGWAIGGHNDPAEHVALLMADGEFGYEGGSRVELELQYDSPYAGHTFGHVRVGIGVLPEAGVERMPVTQGHWYLAGPFQLEEGDEAYKQQWGPETIPELDLEQSFGEGAAIRWAYRPGFVDGKVHSLTAGTNVHFLAREIYSPSARTLDISIGSDDGFAIYLNGEQISQREVPRGAAPDQDRVALPLRAGLNSLVFKVVNTGGAAGYYYKSLPSPEVLAADLLPGILDLAVHGDGGERYEAGIAHAWRLSMSAEYREGVRVLDGLLEAKTELDQAIPKTMVMKDRMEPRQVFVLDRGEYDKADSSRPVEPGVPAAFGGLVPAIQGKPATRLDLANWMVSPDNPLVARVAVNRLWQLIFGTGLVSTSGDFGYQGSWPSHEDLLDWLAVEFVDSGWDVQHMLTLMVSSRAYRAASDAEGAAQDLDPENRWLSHFPRRRLDGEQIRDLALHASGLLHEQFGGVPAKPYQPTGLWSEVAMLASNTRNFEQGQGKDLYRRSVYTYWKRACPPPSMMIFDAPTREYCVVQRSQTNTPLQALALWNDEQFLEAARVLAQRTLAESFSDSDRLQRMFQRCTGRSPSRSELGLLEETLAAATLRYMEAPEAAASWLGAGAAPRPMDQEIPRLAAWTLVASSILNLHSTLTNG
ncbi:MAG: PSD1 and planctomycete cytochrome C domain-containing protein [Planctomycetota bacterium]|nr:PSD1 and planctomycete cytochrome C domain-containing protein [Planctomycetota bacterium]